MRDLAANVVLSAKPLERTAQVIGVSAMRHGRNAMQISFGKLLVFAPDMSLVDEFYGDALGFKQVDSGNDFRIFRGEDFELIVFRCDEAGSRDGYATQAGSCICFSVPDIEVAMQELREKGVDLIHSEPQPGPNLRFAAFADPFGTVHEIVELGS